MTLRPTATPPPECQDFRVSVPAGIVREGPAQTATIITQLNQGTLVCVLGRETNSEWYTLDLNASTRRIDLAYMHESVIEAVNPTPTQSPTSPATRTPSPAPGSPIPSTEPTIDSTLRAAEQGIPAMPPILATVTPAPQ
jgi:hypothetical protein